MRILYKPRNTSKGEKITYRSGETLVSGETYTAGESVDGKLAAGLVANGDAEKLVDAVEKIEEKTSLGSGSSETTKRKTTKRERADGARSFLGFTAPKTEGETVDEVGGD